MWRCPKCDIKCPREWVACRDCGRFKQPEDVNPVQTVIPKVKKLEPEPTPEPKPETVQSKLIEKEDIVRIDERVTSTLSWECNGCGTHHAGNHSECGCCGMEAPSAVLAAINKNLKENLPNKELDKANALTRKLAEIDISDDDDETPDVLVTCDICKLEYGSTVFADHLKGHFAFDMVRKYAEFSSSSVDVDLALELQEQELTRHLEEVSQLAQDKAIALQLVNNDGRKKPSQKINNKPYVPRDSRRSAIPETANQTLISFVTANVLQDFKCRDPTMRQSTQAVSINTVEYVLVVKQLLRTLTGNAASIVNVGAVNRIWNPKTYSDFIKTVDCRKLTMMFHGCRSLDNEKKIIENGFQVQKCVSGGANFGTWFAYNASYSDSGFAYRNAHGITHLFICMVGDVNVKLHNTTMKVVGQGSAYPLYLIEYKRSS